MSILIISAGALFFLMIVWGGVIVHRKRCSMWLWGEYKVFEGPLAVEYGIMVILVGIVLLITIGSQ